MTWKEASVFGWQFLLSTSTTFFVFSIIAGAAVVGQFLISYVANFGVHGLTIKLLTIADFSILIADLLFLALFMIKHLLNVITSMFSEKNEPKSE